MIKEVADFKEAPLTERALARARSQIPRNQRSQQHRQQAASARTASAEVCACKTSHRAKVPTETLHIEVTTSEVTTEAAATEQQATTAARQPQQQLHCVTAAAAEAASSSSRSRAAEDMRPVQAEPAECKHKRHWCRSQGGTSRMSSACTLTTQHLKRRKIGQPAPIQPVRTQ